MSLTKKVYFESEFLSISSSMTMEVKAISEMLEWVKRQAITRVVCLTDSMSTLAKVQKGLLHAD